MQQPFRDSGEPAPEPQVSGSEQWPVESTAAVNSNDGTAAGTGSNDSKAQGDVQIARQPRQIRRVPKPRMSGFFDSPHRNLIIGVIYTLTVMVLGVTAYVAVGWSLRDAVYMVITTVYTVGYEEVRPINTPALYFITISLILLGCTGVPAVERWPTQELSYIFYLLFRSRDYIPAGHYANKLAIQCNRAQYK